MFHPLESCENHSLLPSPFADLEPLAEKWSLATQNQREDASEDEYAYRDSCPV
jgi:hypothetical protein